jgi:hypothetical protein
MTRPIEKIEADQAAAHAAQQAAVEAKRVATEFAKDLRARARKGDTTVTAAALAEAEHAVEFLELPLESKLEAIQALNAEHVLAFTEAWADEVSATEPGLRADIEAKVTNAVEAMRLASEAQETHGAYCQARWGEVGRTVSADVTPRVRRSAVGLHVYVDGKVLAQVPVANRLDQALLKYFLGRP